VIIWYYLILQKKKKIYLEQQQVIDVNTIGKTVWDAAPVLVKYWQLKKESFKNKNILELGSGTGLVGICAAILGGNVIATDYEDSVLNLLKRNAENNSKTFEYTYIKTVEDLNQLFGKENCLYIEKLVWGSDIPDSIKNIKFDIILGSDLIYYPYLLKKLLPTIQNVTQKNTEIIFSYELHCERGADTFFNNVKDIGYDIQEHVPFEQLHPNFRAPDIKVIYLRQSLK